MASGDSIFSKLSDPTYFPESMKRHAQESLEKRKELEQRKSGWLPFFKCVLHLLTPPPYYVCLLRHLRVCLNDSRAVACFLNGFGFPVVGLQQRCHQSTSQTRPSHPRPPRSHRCFLASQHQRARPNHNLSLVPLSLKHHPVLQSHDFRSVLLA
jgi:hypothetical protein